MAPSPKVKRIYLTRQKAADRLKILAKENHKKKRSRDPISDDDSSPSQRLGSFELGSSEIQRIPPWSDDDEVNGEEGGHGAEVSGRKDGGSCSGVKNDETFAKTLRVINVDTSDEEEENMNGGSFSSHGSVMSLFDGEEHESSDDEDDEDYQCEKIKAKSEKGKMKKGNVGKSKYTCRNDLNFDESDCLDKFSGGKGRKGRDHREEIVKEKKNAENVVILDESNGSSEGDSVVVIWPKEDALKKKKGDRP